MSASIEKSLYAGVTKTRFDLFDDVKLRSKTFPGIAKAMAEQWAGK